MKISKRISKSKYTNKLISKAAACSVLMVLPACHIPGLRDAESVPNLPADYKSAANSVPNLPESFSGATSTENSAQKGIEEFYHDPALNSLITQAMSNNRELKILDEEVQISNNEILSWQGSYLPFISFGAGGGLDKAAEYTREGAVDSQLEIRPGRPFPNPLGNSQIGLNLFWQLDIWRQLRNARDAAELRYLATLEKRNYFVTRLIAEVAEKYYELMALDQRMANLDKTIELQEQSLEVAKAKKAAARGTELAVQRFEAEVRKNQSEKLIIKQEMIEVENRINFLMNRFPTAVERTSTGFFDLNINTLSVGIPAQLLQNRADIRQAEREVEAAGLDIKVARANFYPNLAISTDVGYAAFNPRYLFQPEAFAANVVGSLAAPLVNTKAIQAEYLSANAKQLQAIYNYQRVTLNAFTEVINRVSMVENYRKSIQVKKQQLAALEASVDTASKLFQNARAEYVEVLLAQRDLMEARMELITTKKQELSAIVNAYQALGGGNSAAISSQNLPNEKPIIEKP
jgi:multidrug efflux system outer membrane protein